MPVLRYANVAAKYANVVCNENITVICMIESQVGLANVE